MEENMYPGKYHSVVKTIPSAKFPLRPKSLLTSIECFGVPWLSLHLAEPGCWATMFIAPIFLN